jgi:hypothetical protein|tara:strand:+ start:500 stop:679 length:180 start_codon:yes stop_codon:yes gene_type:complete
MDSYAITSAQYVNNHTGETDHIEAVIDGVKCFVPLDTDNSHYQAILDWVAEGNTIAEAD